MLIILAIIDSVLLWKRTKKQLLARFGEDTSTQGLAMYQVMRTFQMRRTRMPKPMVDRGDSLR